MFDKLINYTFLFFLFSVIGWVIECTYRSLGEKKIINSGFLYGPMCPIYGTGCLAFELFLVPLSQPIEKRIILVLLLGMLLADLVEYFTSFAMEKLFNARWWDYSGNFLNLHGRICFKHTCYWAIFAFVYTYIIAPTYHYVMSFIPQNVRTAAVVITLVILAFDLTLTVKAVADINKLMKKLTFLKESVLKKADAVRNATESTYNDIKAGTNRLGEIKDDIYHQYIEAVLDLHVLEEKNDKITKRFLSIYSFVRKAADSAVSEIETAWNDIKDFFTDSDK